MRLTSIAAYNEMKENGKLGTRRAQILKVIARRANISLREIQRTLNKNRDPWTWIDVGTISARVKEMKDAGILAEETLPRKCMITGKTIRPVYVVA